MHGRANREYPTYRTSRNFDNVTTCDGCGSLFSRVYTTPWWIPYKVNKEQNAQVLFPQLARLHASCSFPKLRQAHDNNINYLNDRHLLTETTTTVIISIDDKYRSLKYMSCSSL